MLYRLLKKVYQSFRTFLCSGDRSYQSGRHSSSLREDCARARDASLPANTFARHSQTASPKGHMDRDLTFITPLRPIRLIPSNIKDRSLHRKGQHQHPTLTSSSTSVWVSRTLIATYVGKPSCFPVRHQHVSNPSLALFGCAARTITFGKMVHADDVVLGWVQVDFVLRLEFACHLCISMLEVR